MKKIGFVGLVFGFLLLIIFGSAQANLINNPSFENVTGPFGGQGYLPDNWTVTNVTPDTYSNDGSWGFLPNSPYPNFTGVTAYDGIRWVAGWSSYSESFGTWLNDTLVAGTEYLFSGWLHQAYRSDLNNPGGYQIYLSDAAGIGNGTTIYLDLLGNTVGYAAGWQEFSFSFTATGLMENLGFLEFVPTGSSAYPGLDLVALEIVGGHESPVPEPTTVLLLGIGLLGIAGVSRKKK